MISDDRSPLVISDGLMALEIAIARTMANLRPQRNYFKMPLLTGAALVVLLAGLVVLFVKRFETTLETKVGPVKTPLGITLVVLGLAGLAFPYTPYFTHPGQAVPLPSTTCCGSTPTVSSRAIDVGPEISPSVETSPQGPSVTLIYPVNGSPVSRSKGFRANGTTAPLGAATIWIADHDSGGYTIDQQAEVKGTIWSAVDSPLGDSTDTLPFSLTMSVIVAGSDCAATLRQLIASNDNDYTAILPAGCTVVDEVAVTVSSE